MLWTNFGKGVHALESINTEREIMKSSKYSANIAAQFLFDTF